MTVYSADYRHGVRVYGRAIILVVGLLLAAPIVAACGAPTQPCGAFAFTGAPHASQGIDMSLDFTFNPATCSATGSPNATTVAFVQIVRIIDRTDGSFLAPSTEQFNRIITGNTNTPLNGWAIDRLTDRVWGYYGRNNNGAFSGTVTTGSSTSTGTLRDSPAGWPNQSWFDAVTVPVCLVGNAACQDRLVGYFYWLFIVDTSGTVGNPFNQIGVDWNQDAVDAAVVEWNNDATGLGKNQFPTFTRMP